MVRSDPLPLGRDAAAVAGAVSVGRLFLLATASRWIRLLPFLLLRELAIYRNLYGGRAGTGAAARDDGRSGFCGARLPCNLHAVGRFELRHYDRGCRTDAGLVRDAGMRRVVSAPTAGTRRRKKCADHISPANDIPYREISRKRGQNGLPPGSVHQRSTDSYGTQSAVKMLVSCVALAFRFEADTAFSPSAEII